MTEIQIEDATMGIGRAARHVAAGKKAPAPPATPPRAPAARQASPSEVAKILKDAALAVTQAGANPNPEGAVAVAIRVVAVNNPSLAGDPEFRRDLWRIANHQINVTEAEVCGWIDAAVKGEANGAAAGNALAADLYRNAGPAPSPAVPVPDKPLDANGMHNARGSEELRRHIDAAKPEPQPIESIPKDGILAPEPEKIAPLRWLDMSNWDNEPRPHREWAIPDRVPNRQVGLFSGEGGTGKSIIEMMKDVAHVAGKDWFGSMPTIGGGWYIGAEDEEKEIHIRFHDIAAHYGVTFKELTEKGLKVLCLLGQDATLCAATRGGKVETTALYRQMYEAAGDLKPKNTSIDTLSRAFAGNELDRSQVYGFAMHMQAFAKVADGSVTVLSHPSLQGIASGSGISGSTAWHGAFRFRQYLKTPKVPEGEPPDTDIRELEFKKNQYGPRGAAIAVRYLNGVFVPVGGIAPLAQIAAEADVDRAYLDCLDAATGQGRKVFAKTGSGFAPDIFQKMPQARGYKTAALQLAQERLFAAGRIHAIAIGPPSRQTYPIARKHLDDLAEAAQ